MRKLWYIPILLLIIQCGHPVMPTGGPQDITPPMVEQAVPANYSPNFDAEKIYISFDEFISLKNPRNEIFISPPMDEFPEFKVKGKKLIASITEELKPNTTYTLFFGNAIVDITEGNPKSNFEYVFSTGDVIDSLSVSGAVLQAFDLQPVENVLVMLYYDNNDTIVLDSLPLYVRPFYASKTNEFGEFRINNLKEGPYCPGR